MGRGKGTTESKISMKGERVRERERERSCKKRGRISSPQSRGRTVSTAWSSILMEHSLL